MQPKNILVICWGFPPHQGIGGRRWAKISRSLLKLGHPISLISNSYAGVSQKIPWISNEELLKIKRYTLSENVLVKWLNDYESPIRAIKIRIARFLLNQFFKGTIYDRTVGIEKKFIALVRNVIHKDKIDIVFVTGAPFNLIYYTAKLKNEFKEVKVIADYRDPWIKAHNYGMSHLSPKRERQELEKQNFIFENVDYVTAPNSVLLHEIRNMYAGDGPVRAKFVELLHAFDPLDVSTHNTSHGDNKKIRIVYAGALYFGTEPSLHLLNDSLKYIKQKTGFDKVEIFFYTDQKIPPVEITSKENFIKFSESIGDRIFDVIKSADFILILLARHNKNYLTSKFFEFLPYQKPYLSIGPEGLVSETIIKEGFGFHLKNKEDLYNIVSSPETFIPKNTAIQKYSFDAVTKDLLQAIDN